MQAFDSPDFRNLPERAKALFDEAGEDSIFNLAEWYDVVVHYGLPANAKARLFVDDRARAGLVICEMPKHMLALCTTPYTCESAPLGDAANVRALVSEIARDARAATLRWTGFDPSAATFPAMLAGLKDAGFIAAPFTSWVNWYEGVRDCDFETYLARRPSALRNTWQRKLKAISKEQQPVFRLNGDVEAFIADYESVYRRSWKTPEPFGEFMPALLRRLSALGAVRSGVLACGGEPIAAQFWLLWRGRATIFKLAYDEKWSRYSPGTLLTMEMLRSVLAEDRPHEIDFGRGDDPYKKTWLSQRRERWGIEAANPRMLRGAAAAARIAARWARDRLRPPAVAR